MKHSFFFLSLLLLLLQASRTMADTRLEAELASYSNCRLVCDSKYSCGKALELTESNASITFSYTSAASGKYIIYVGADALYGDKQVNLSVNGNASTFQVSGQSETAVGTYIMNAGENTIQITPNWTWFRIDYIRIETPAGTVQFDIAPQPVDADATSSARKLYTFLHDNFGKKTLSGIMTGSMESATADVTQHADVQAVYQVSGKHPALIGFDFMNTTGLKEADSWNVGYTAAVMQLVRDTYRRGGLPAFTWHWRDPSRATEEFYTDKCSMKITDAMNADGTWNTSSTLYANLVKDIHTVGRCLLELQKDSIACIFRPLHEASGGWFWWGREGKEPFIKLYQLVYDEMVNNLGVHNVIWVWNADTSHMDWDPGSDRYDGVSLDIYNEAFDYSSNYVAFDNLKTLTQGKKILALSENGPIPDIDKEFAEDAVWSWWMPWYQTWGGNFVDKTSAEEWTKCMNDPRVVTLEDRSAGWEGYTSVRGPHGGGKQNDGLYDLQGRCLDSVHSHTLCIKDGRKFVSR